MSVSVPLQEAASSLLALVAKARSSHQEMVLTENGEPIAKLVPFPPKRTREEVIKSIRELQEWWMSVTTEEERESFAQDIEAGRKTVGQIQGDPWA
jgi:antitoxin (DNA-binding transcriptional repressor) of toxin-antitoxin stability system